MKWENIKKNMLLKEELYSEYACRDEKSIRIKPIDNDFRPNFFRDTDRIFHSLAYTRYIDKTQVYTHMENDHITKRIIHVQLVTKIARTIGRALSLNEDLIEAIGLAHDIGHVPFGHPGEKILNELSLKYTGVYFAHNIQGVREYMTLENGSGLNLSIQVLDGILCHNGEKLEQVYYPKEKTKEDFLEDYKKCYQNIEYARRVSPMTLEGCVVKISDLIGYLGRDIEDAIRLGKLKSEDIPKSIKETLGTTNREIVNTIVLDIIENSLDKPYIKLSDSIFKAIEELKEFNYKYIYYKANSKENLEYYEYIFTYLFEYYLKNITNEECSIRDFLKEMSNEYNESTSNERKVIDYLAGMTDEYIIREYDKYSN